MNRIEFARTAQAIIWTILLLIAVYLYILFGSWVGQKLHEADVEQQERAARKEQEARKARLEKLLALADEYEAAETDKQRSQTYRKATDLGFTDGPENEWQRNAREAEGLADDDRRLA